jgi:hypothetical protein
MADMALFQGQVRDRQAESHRAAQAWSLDQIVFAVVLGLAYACVVLAIALPIYVWLD